MLVPTIPQTFVQFYKNDTIVRMRAKHFLFLFSIAGLFLMNGCSHKKEVSPFAQTSSETLYKEFMDDEKGADQKYTGKLVQIKGTIIRKGQDTGERPWIAFQGDAVMGDVQCFFIKEDEPKAAELPIGSTVVVEGTCLGRLIHLTFDDCKILN